MDYMSLALSLARLAQGQVSPNPAVGAVIVKNEVIIGQGYTQPPGSDHAEIVALKQAGEDARGASPLRYPGALLPLWPDSSLHPGYYRGGYQKKSISPYSILTRWLPVRVIKELQQAGIKIISVEHAAEADELNEAYNKFITTGMPFVTVKFAASLDGKIATRTGDSKWITGEAARKHVQHMRYLSRTPS